MNCANSTEPHCNPPVNEQTSGTSANDAVMSYEPKSVCLYRVCLVKDHTITFGENLNIANPCQAQAILKHQAQSVLDAMGSYMEARAA
jgi:hypothetical protein